MTIECAGEDCPNIIRLQGKIKGVNGRLLLVIGFIVATMGLQGWNTVDINRVKVTLANVNNTATKALDKITEHYNQRLPERSREIHQKMNTEREANKDNIMENKYEIKRLWDEVN